MSPTLRKALLALACAAQLAVPASLVVKHERTHASGTAWKFQTAPVDPNDPFRGKYVQLAYAVERKPVPFADTGTVYVAPERRMYAELKAGDDGYARLVRLHDRRPASGDYVDVFTQRQVREELPPSTALVRLPFDRYYLPEDIAPEIERRYRDASAAAQANTWVEVRVRDGHAAVVGLVLDGTPVRAKP